MNAEAKTLAAEAREIKVGDRFLVEMEVLGIDEGGRNSFSVSVSGHSLGVPRHALRHELLAGTRLPAPVEGVGLETTAQERDQWRYSVNPFSGEDKERLLRDFNRIVSSLLKADLGRQDAIAAIDAKEAERLFWKERAHEGATAAVQVATELDAIRAERDALKAALEEWLAAEDAWEGRTADDVRCATACENARAALSTAQGGE